MKKAVCAFLLILGFSVSAHATKIKATDLSVLVARADYIVVGKVVKLDMIDAKGHEIVDKKITTGPRSGNTIRLYVEIDRKKTLKGNIREIPKDLVLPDWPMWIRDLEGMKAIYGGQTCIFLLRKPDFFPEPQSEFIRDLAEKKKIEKIIKSQHPNTKQ